MRMCSALGDCEMKSSTWFGSWCSLEIGFGFCEWIMFGNLIVSWMKKMLRLLLIRF